MAIGQRRRRRRRKFEVSCWQLHSTTTDEVVYCIPFKIVLVTELLLLERVSGLILTGPLTELRFAQAWWLHRPNIRVLGTLSSADAYATRTGIGLEHRALQSPK